MESQKEANFLFKIEMGLGAWSWGDRIVWNYGHGYNDADIASAFQTSITAGVNFIDTAELYGNGRSEILLGKLIHTTQQPVMVASKFMPFPWRMNGRAVVRALQASLTRLNLEKLDLYQIHWPSPLIPVDVFAEGLADVVKLGLTRSVGVSNYNRNQMQRVYTVLANHNIPLVSNQVEYHLLNRKIEKVGLLDRCSELGIRVIAYSPLAKGLLTGKYSPKNPPPPSRGHLSKENLHCLEKLTGLMAEIGNGHGNKSPAAVAINWVICKGALPIPGAKNQAQAAENIASLGWRLSVDEMKALEAAGEKCSG